MKCFLHYLKWYLKIGFLFGKMSLQSQLEYPLNFVSGVFVELAYMMIKLVYLYVVVTTGMNVGSLTPDQVILFVGTYVFMTGIWMLLSGVNDVPGTVINGGLDLLMTKPGSLQFLQTFGKYNFGLMLPNIIAGMVLTILGWMRSGIAASLLNIALFLFYMACAVLLTYAFSLISSLLIFWITSVNAVYTMYCAFWDYNNMPMELYPKIIKQIGTFIIPIFLITNWQGLAILGKLSVSELIWGACFPIVAFLLSRLMWTRGIRKYISANG